VVIAVQYGADLLAGVSVDAGSRENIGRQLRYFRQAKRSARGFRVPGSSA
jgi:hypothetical protein